MRSRLIRQEFWKSEDVAELSFFGRLLFQGLWCLADRRGVLRWSPRRVKAELFPFDDVTADSCLTQVRLMSDLGQTTLYSDAEGVEYLHITNFDKHQTLSSGEKKRGELNGPLPTEPGCSVLLGQTRVRPKSDSGQRKGGITVTVTDTVTEKSKSADLGQTSGDESELLRLVSLVRGAHDECSRIPDFVVSELIRGEGLDWSEPADVARIEEAVGAFARDWAGSAFSGHVTPQKELRKYLRTAVAGKFGKKERAFAGVAVDPTQRTQVFAGVN